MKGRKTNIVIITQFVFMLISCNLIFWILPDRSFSENENRYLTEMPEFSAASLVSGKWMTDMEDYIGDQFPGRDRWIVLQAAVHRASGRKDNNGVYYGDSLIQTFWTVDREQLRKNLTAVREYAENDGNTEDAGDSMNTVNTGGDGENMNTGNTAHTWFVPVPNACAVNSSELPSPAPDADQGELLEEMNQELKTGNGTASTAERADSDTASTAEDAGSENLTLVNTLSSLRSAAAEGKQLYYRTDHHMTMEGAWIVYSELMRSMGVESLPEESFTRTIVSDTFCGTLYRKSGIWWVKPDTMERWDPADPTELTLELTASGKTCDSLYNVEALSTADKYSYYAYGNQPVEVIRTNASGGKLLVIKDSYAHELLPLLAQHFSEIHVIDPRYYMGSVEDYREKNGIGQTVILYNISNFCEDTYISRIAR